MSCFHVFYGSVLNNVLHKKNFKIPLEIHNNMAHVYMHYEKMQCQTTAKMIFFSFEKQLLAVAVSRVGFWWLGYRSVKETMYTRLTFHSFFFFNLLCHIPYMCVTYF